MLLLYHGINVFCRSEKKHLTLNNKHNNIQQINTLEKIKMSAKIKEYLKIIEDCSKRLQNLNLSFSEAVQMFKTLDDALACANEVLRNSEVNDINEFKEAVRYARLTTD